MALHQLQAANTLCIDFDRAVADLKAMLTESSTAVNRSRMLEDKEVDDIKAHDREMDDIQRRLEDLESSRIKIEESKVVKMRMKDDEKLTFQKIEQVRRLVKELEEEKDKLQLYVAQKKQKLHEVVMSRQAVIASWQNLKTENSKLKEEISYLEEKHHEYRSNQQRSYFDEGKDINDLLNGKTNFRKLQQEAIDLKNRMQKITNTLEKDASQLVSRENKLKTLKQVNKTLQKKFQLKKELEQRHVELTEQSLNLQFLMSEFMKELAQNYDIQNSEIEDTYRDLGDPAQIIAQQQRQIQKLSKKVDIQRAGVSKLKHSHLVHEEG